MPFGYGKEHHWTHFAMCYKLPYWSSHKLRKYIDFMYTEKNVFENMFYTVMDDKKKSQDHLNARKDCKILGQRPDLWLDGNGVKPKAPYTLTRAQL